MGMRGTLFTTIDSIVSFMSDPMACSPQINRNMEDLKAYCVQWLWTAKKGGADNWWVISHAAKDGEDKTPCGLDTTKGWWDGAGADLTERRPSCMRCIAALRKRGIVPKDEHGSMGMTIARSFPNPPMPEPSIPVTVSEDR